MIELSPEETVIECQNITTYLGSYQALTDLSMKIPRNKITTILGFSGAGKTTLLKHFLGLIKPTEGKIKVLGQELISMSPYELRNFRRNFGMAFQYSALFDSLSAFENVAFPLREFSDLDEEGIRAKVTGLLESVDIEQDSFDKLPSALSGGMRKRVGFARALALSPQIMLYDEPTTGLDPITTKVVNDLILETAAAHRERGLTSIIISHDVKATMKISDFVAFLERGRIIEYLPADEFLRSKNEHIRKFLELEGY
jgi:phospholipid/cholesterol/gamma-HCH transport system ATP-binding protein